MTTSVKIINRGFQSVTVSHRIVKPFSTVQVPLPLHFEMADGRRVDVSIDPKTGLVMSPDWVSKRSNGVWSRPWAQVLRQTRPYELKVWNTTFGVPWFCTAGTLALFVLALVLVILLIVKLRK